MATTKNENPFAKFQQHPELKAYIKSLDYEITYRKLTSAEDDAYNLRLLKDVKKDGQNYNIKAGSDIKYEKIEKMLIDPVITAKELRAMDTDVQVAMVEILKVIEASSMVDNEGNLES